MSDHRNLRIAAAIRNIAADIEPLTLDEIRSRPPVHEVPAFDRRHDHDTVPEHHSTTGDGAMVIQLENRPDAPTPSAGESPPGNGRERWRRVGLVAAGVAAVAIAIGAWQAGSDDEPVEVLPAETPEVTDDPVAEQTATVDRFIDAFNAGDARTMEGLLADGAENKRIDPTFVAAHDQWTRVGPCRQDPGGALVCPVRRMDDFHGAAGLSIEADYVFGIDATGRIDRLNLLNEDPWDAYLAFRAEFRAWMAQSHPEVSMRYFPPAGSFSDELADMPQDDSMPTALDLVDEFVAQSAREGS